MSNLNDLKNEIEQLKRIRDMLPKNEGDYVAPNTFKDAQLYLFTSIEHLKEIVYEMAS
ncbi:MAG: hypothetical protein M0Q91_16335 [Methanoregula sp.]|jgi:hypothetical protein|nr:hypothetical protein [Methanoregula sp.]